MIPDWALLGLCAALVMTAVPLIQEKMKADGFALAFIIKVVSALLLLPFVLYQGLPTDPRFYFSAAVTSALWAVSDVIYFRSVPIVGAGVVSRLIPSAVIISFILWFFVDPSLLDKYIERPIQAAAIITIICCSAVFATLLKKCPVSWQGARMIWFVIFAASTGPLIEKFTLGYASKGQAPYAFTFIQALFMLAFWAVFFLIRRPIPVSTLFSPTSIKAGCMIGLCSACAVTLRFTALQTAEHPAYLSVILFTDALWIVLVHRVMGKRDTSNIWAGLGIVACAVALIVAKSF